MLTLNVSIFCRVLVVMALVQISVRNGEAVTISVNSASYDIFGNLRCQCRAL
jgi:hypothetical protein